jgi:crotonobetainyl-CoA:carnitine CoA-transferase CaiB-like acyl-CoA transferase
MHPGFPMGDMTTGLMGAYGIMLALYHIQRGGRGQVIDLGIYEAPLRLIDYHVPIRTGTDRYPTRNGNRQPMSFALSGVYKTSDGRWLTYSAATFPIAKRVLSLIGGEAWANDPRFTSLQAVCKCDDEVDARMKQWMEKRTAEDVIQQFKEAQAVVELIRNVDDILADPHIEARQNIVGFEGEPCKVVNAVPNLSATPGRVRWLGRAIGQDTTEILAQDIGLTKEQIADLYASGAVS